MTRCNDFFFCEKTGFKDDLNDGTILVTHFGDGIDFIFDISPVSGFGLADIHNHIDFISTIFECQLNLISFCIGSHGTEWETAHGSDFYVRGDCVDETAGGSDMTAVDTDRGHIILDSFRYQFENIRSGCFRF